MFSREIVDTHDLVSNPHTWTQYGIHLSEDEYLDGLNGDTLKVVDPHPGAVGHWQLKYVREELKNEI